MQKFTKSDRQKADTKDFAKTCVCMANAQGGYIVLGLEGEDKLPPLEQTIDQTVLNTIVKRLRSFPTSPINPPQTP